MDYYRIRRIVQKYLGTPWVVNGRDTGGIDCGGLVIRVWKEYGYSLPDFEGRDIVENKWYLKNDRVIINLLEEVAEKVDSIKPLDALVFEIGGKPIHVGIVVNKRQFLHIIKEKNVVIDNIENWRGRLAAVYRLKSGDD